MGKAIGILTLVLFISFLLSSTCFAQTTEQLDITTYYPSPTGVYSRLRLFPSVTPDPTLGCSQEGDMYYHSVSGRSYICDGAVWRSLASLWTNNGNSFFPNNLNWNVGIGTNSPTEKLDVRGDIAGSGNLNIGGDITAAGKVDAQTVCVGGDCRNGWPVSGILSPPASTNAINTLTGTSVQGGVAGWTYSDGAFRAF